MTPERAHGACGERRSGLNRPSRRIFVFPIIVFILGVSLGVASLLGGPTLASVHSISAGHGLLGTSQPAGRIPAGPAQSSGRIVPAVQEPGRVVTASIAEPIPPAPISWSSKTMMKTTDGEPGGELDFDPGTGWVRVCDLEPDDDRVEGKVLLGETEKVGLLVEGHSDICKTAHIENYVKGKSVTYEFTVCLRPIFGVNLPAYCQGSTSAKAQWPIAWQEMESIKSGDSDPGARLQWDPKSGRVRVCDIEQDNHGATGGVISGDDVVAFVRADKSGHCDEAAIAGYDSKVQYTFKVCLVESNGVNDYCNTSDNSAWPEANCGNPTGDADLNCGAGVGNSCTHTHGPAKAWCEGENKVEDPCAGLIKAAKKYCTKGQGGGTDDEFEVPKAPGGQVPSANDRPDKELHSAGRALPPGAAKPVGTLLGWVKWAASGACVAGFMMVGANMALKHRRGEIGDHAVGMGWVTIACIVGGSGVAAAFISILFDPL